MQFIVTFYRLDEIPHCSRIEGLAYAKECAKDFRELHATHAEVAEVGKRIVVYTPHESYRQDQRQKV